MASEVSSMPNGAAYAPHQPYVALEQSNFAYANNAQVAQPTPQQAPPASSTPSNAQQQAQPDIPKDEVGWYFVEQYYTTLSRSPEKLYLFYNKRSQFVSGQETDKVAVCVGQRAINDKIRELDLSDCKVRVTNVDSQASDSNIVIQVIGELSNRGQPHRKFTQTFVLATQTNGYFVLNDIFRYLVEEEDEPEAEAEPQQEEVQQVSGTESVQEPAPTEAKSQTLTSSSDASAVEHDAKEAAHEIEEKLVNGHQAEEAPAAEASELPAAEESKPEEEAPAAEPAAELERVDTSEVDKQPEKPKDPEPTPQPATPKEPVAPATPVSAPTPAPAPKPAAPAAPKTWASLAASALKVATPAAPPAAAPAAAARPASKPASAPQAPSAASSTPAAPPAAPAQDIKGSDSQDEWTAVGSSHNRQQSKQVSTAAPQEQPKWRGYIKNVQDGVNPGQLRAELEKFGELEYFDVARQKNCAFVDFKTEEAYNKATSTAIKLGDTELYVEERRIRPGSTPYVQRGQYTGGRGGPRGGSGQGAPRGNYQGNRGNATPRGRGGYAGAGQRGGRGGAQA